MSLKKRRSTLKNIHSVFLDDDQIPINEEKYDEIKNKLNIDVNRL